MQCWVGILSAMAKYESGFDPNQDYKEDMIDVDGTPVISRGLLQISKTSANSYGCAIGKAAELHDPETNIRCGVRILAKWIPNDGFISSSKMIVKDGKQKKQWLGGARYWAVLRDKVAQIRALSIGFAK